jgi:hypothetical protein
MFALRLFVSATLLFLLQPMIGKMLLPMLGGRQWNGTLAWSSSRPCCCPRLQ